MADVFEGKCKCIALFRIDNRAFQRSALKGWSRAERLSLLLKQVFQVSVQCECIPEYEWLSTDVNIFADALSRPNGHSLFLQRVREYDPLPPGATLRPHPQCAMVRRFGRAFASDEDGDGPPCGRGVLVWCACLLLRFSVCGAARGGSHARVSQPRERPPQPHSNPRPLVSCKAHAGLKLSIADSSAPEPLLAVGIGVP